MDLCFLPLLSFLLMITTFLSYICKKKLAKEWEGRVQFYRGSVKYLCTLKHTVHILMTQKEISLDHWDHIINHYYHLSK